MLSSKAYTEVYYIINSMSEELREKIPEKIQKNIENRMDKEYQFYVENDDFENVGLLEDTEKILSVLYTDYLASDEEREIILNKEKIIASKNKKSVSEIKINDVFSKKEKAKIREQYLVEVKEEKWYTKISNFFKNLFK